MKTLINLSFSILISINDDAVLHYALQHSITFKEAFRKLAKIVILDAVSQKL